MLADAAKAAGKIASDKTALDRRVTSLEAMNLLMPDYWIISFNSSVTRHAHLFLLRQ
jgi:hypothetical protein